MSWGLTTWLSQVVNRIEYPPVRTRNLCLMLTDIKGFTARTAESTRDGVSKLVTEHERLLVPVFRYFEGRVIKTIGDAFLVAFESPTDAVLCGLTIQEVLRQYNAFVQTDRDRLDVRVAINVGDVEVRDDGDVFGEPVNLLARLEGITDAGEVFFTEAVYLSMNRREVPSAEVGERVFEGIPHAVRVFRVVRDPNSEQARKMADAVRLTKGGPVIRGLRERPRSVRGKVAAAVGGFALIAAVALAALMMPKDESEQARRLIREGQFRTALEILEPLVLKRPTDEGLRALVLEAGRAQIEVVGRDQGLASAADWVRKSIDAKPYLEVLKGELPTLDMRVVCEDIYLGKHGSSLSSWGPPIRKVLDRFPGNAEICFLAAELVQRTMVVESTLYLYKEAVSRGGDARDQRIFNACVKVLGTNTVADSAGAHELLRAHFSAERVRWAKEAFDRGPERRGEEESIDAIGYWLGNAAHILKEADDATLRKSFHAALRDLAARERIFEACEELLKQTDAARGRRALEVVERLLDLHDRDVAKLPTVGVERLRETRAELERRWGGSK